MYVMDAQVLIAMLKPYARVTITFLAQELKLELNDVVSTEHSLLFGHGSAP